MISIFPTTIVNNIKEYKIQAPNFCIYFLCQNDTIVYIGQTFNIQSRISSHIKDKEFNSVYYIEIPDIKDRKTAELVETLFIGYFKPSLNICCPIDDTPLCDIEAVINSGYIPDPIKRFWEGSGRPKQYNDVKKSEVIYYHKQNKSVRQIAKLTGVSKSSVFRIISECTKDLSVH